MVVKNKIKEIRHDKKALLLAIAKLPDESTKDLFRIAETGIDCKYPPCCIIDFCADLGKNKPPAQSRALDHSGFIPCKKHYQEYKNKVDKLKQLRVIYK